VRFRGGLWPLYYALTIPGFSASILYRLSRAVLGKGFLGKHSAMFLWHLNYFLHSCHIPPELKVGPGFFLPHPTGIVLGLSSIGKNCSIYQNVTIGLKDLVQVEMHSDLFPVLGDNVVIAAGAVILGQIKIGNNVRIGANAVVLSDVPDNATAVGVPARILHGGK